MQHYKYNQQFVSQYGVVIGEKYYRFDFAVIENGQVKYLLEYHGLQHYDDKYLHWGKDVSVNQERDAIKEKWAYDNGIHLYVIPYTEFDNLEEIIKDISVSIDNTSRNQIKTLCETLNILYLEVDGIDDHSIVEIYNVIK